MSEQDAANQDAPKNDLPKKYEPGRAMKAANSVMRVLARAGLIPKTSVLSVRGRKSGELRSMPVTPIEVGGSVWLVSPYGTVAWVHNVRAAGEVTLARGRTTRRFATREADAVEAGPVLKRYVAVAPLVLPYFTAKPDDPVEAFAAEADRHPVFELAMLDEA
ncbi:nitroreductase family deazaflavin-dependent oxidoreductase [Agromyces sp. Marseille-Q5079]|uniref:nitroreductase family deazaflavin-dependent oxidoreductase n=1 Tax=Agromyces sp. Marseille-Q5079 TaxID=3439059 RepID=UPI003D9C847A